MRIYKYLIRAAACAVLATLPSLAGAQESSINTYSPYSMYGIGGLNRSSSPAFASMGGVGIGFRNAFADVSGKGGFDTPFSTVLNLANPASLSALPERSFIFDVGMSGSNVYLRQRSDAGLLRTSYNTFNVSNITIAFPIFPKVGMAFNVSPYSRVGYNIHTDDESHMADMGLVRYYYFGEGDVSEAKASLGWEPFRGLSLGAEVNYLWGDIVRTYNGQIVSYVGTGTYGNMSGTASERIGRIYGGFGAQYTPLLRPHSRLTLGATYRMGGLLNSKVSDYITASNISSDVVRLNEYTSPTYIPQKIGVGAFFHRPKWAAGVDFTYEDWANKNAPDTENDMRYVNVSTLRIGGQYTPNRLDIRGKVSSFFNRITYKAGFRTGQSYMQFRGVAAPERAVTVGIDMPFRAENVSTLSIGLELGTMGSLQKSLVKENYFKVNVGVMLFGKDHDYWFEKPKYN